MKRSFVSTAKDKKIFSRTAKRTRRANIVPDMSRGGIRL